MIGYKVLAKDGLKGPFKKSSIIKAITTAMLPLQARLLDLQTGLYVRAAELVGEEVERRKGVVPEAIEDGGLKLAEEVPEDVEETPRIIFRGKIPLKRARLPRPRKLGHDGSESELNNPAA